MHAGFYTYNFAALCFLLLAALSLTVKRRNSTGTVIVCATLLSLVSALIAANINESIDSSYNLLISRYGYIVSELFHSVGWCVFLAMLVKPGNEKRRSKMDIHMSPLLIASIFGLVSTLIVFFTHLHLGGDISNRQFLQLNSISWICLAILGLVLVERLYQHTEKSNRWTIKHLFLGLSIVFAYDVLLYTNALLGGYINSSIWNARGIVNGLAVPLIAISIARNAHWSLNIHVSRDIVFHSVSVIGAGIYILVSAFLAYSIQFFETSWSEILQISFFAATLILSGVYFLSENIQARSKQFIEKHLYSHKYDYRKEWLLFTDTLANHEADVSGRVLAAILGITKSPTGNLWVKDVDHSYSCTTNTSTASIDSIAAEYGIELKDYFEVNPSVHEFSKLYSSISDVPEISALRHLYNKSADRWLIIPLQYKSQNIGFIEIHKTARGKILNWEDRDFLEAASLQAAAFLALHQSNRQLVEARQFEAFNKLSTYVVHDLKNILGQLTLIINNSKVHGKNPEFIDDVVQTLEHSNTRITSLLQQLRIGAVPEKISKVDLNELIEDICMHSAIREPRPSYDSECKSVEVLADRSRLSRGIAHLVQNAQEAAGKNGLVNVKLFSDDSVATIQVIDNGSGMNPDFISSKLFQPFYSTKGLTGMGIGAYESKEYIKSIGGTVEIVSSTQDDTGTIFTITIPTLTTN